MSKLKPKEASETLGSVTADVIREGKATISEVAHKAAATVETIKDTGKRAGDSYTEARQNAYDWEQGVETYIRRRPLRAVLAAFGLGYLFCLIFRSRR